MSLELDLTETQINKIFKAAAGTNMEISVEVVCVVCVGVWVWVCVGVYNIYLCVCLCVCRNSSNASRLLEPWRHCARSQQSIEQDCGEQEAGGLLPSEEEEEEEEELVPQRPRSPSR
jgi:hypothetical protein